jgi:hypothetical protein
VTAVAASLRRLTLIALLLVAPVVAGCGGEDHASSDTPARPKGGYIAAADLERQLGNAFRQGLYRLAVMSQRSDEAKDLGQPLPTGLLDDVSCSSSAEKPGGGRVWMWSCAVRWKSVRGRRQLTRYAVRLSPGECFAAGATPARAERYDATIRSYSEDPLNVLGSVRPGC